MKLDFSNWYDKDWIKNMGTLKILLPVFTIVAMAFVLPENCLASTWYIEADGSGDFPTIQLAADSAEPGDTIVLGAGVFDDYITAPNSPFWEVYVRISTDNLTICGAGIDETIIGQAVDDAHANNVTMISVIDGISLRLENLTLQLRDWPGSLLACSSDTDLTIVNCGFRDAQGGLKFYGTSLNMSGCDFSGLDDAASVLPHSPSVIQDCRFEQVKLGLYVAGPELLTVTSCVFDGRDSGGNSAGAYMESDGYAEFRDCSFFNHTRAAMLVSGFQTNIYDCEILEDEGSGLELYGGNLSGSGNIIFSETWVLFFRYIGSVDFRNNHFLTSGDGMLAMVYADSGPPTVVDLANNWWGTESASEIGARIHDSHDDSKLTIEVNYQPFHGGPVAVEKRSFGGIKAMFR